MRCLQRPEYYGLSCGHKGRPGGNLAVGDVLSGLARALGQRAASEGQEPQRMAQGAKWDWVGIEGSVMKVDISPESGPNC
jgi:hypothetical protein